MKPTDAPFEEPLVELRRKIEELESFPPETGRQKEVEKLKAELARATEGVYKRLDRWQKTLVARHSDRPHTLDYVDSLLDDWVELHGDRRFADDPAIVAGFGNFRGRSVCLVGHQKGRGTKERIHRNFGQPRPEGYRKALRVMKLAEKFGRPIISLVDTPGAFPGLGAEERGQAEAIAVNQYEMSRLEVPIVVTVTGEGGSGGALALGIGDRVLMLEYAVYSVISPEGCAAILWKDQEKRQEAAEALKLAAPDLLRLGVVDEVLPEPLGAAHAAPEVAIATVGDRIDEVLGELEGVSVEQRLEARYDRFRQLGEVVEA